MDELVKRLRSLKVLLGTDSPEVRGWSSAVQQAAQKTVNDAIAALSAQPQQVNAEGQRKILWEGEALTPPQKMKINAEGRRSLTKGLFMNDQQIKYMVQRFLGWRLPENFSPDAGISFKAAFNENTPYPGKHEPVGTNLFSAEQAEQMILYLIDGMPTSAPQSEQTHVPVAESHCVWMQDSDGPWNTSCGHVFEFTDGGPHQNNAAWCQYCGGKLLPTYHDGEQESVERNAALLAAAKEPRK